MAVCFNLLHEHVIFLHVGRLDIPQGSVATCLSWGEIFIKRLHYKFTTEFNAEKN